MLSNAYRQVKKAECLDDFMIAHRNKVFAAKAWFREQDCYRNRHQLAEFKAGFMEGYMDVANGSNGCIPCVAPSQYWGWKYQSPGGQAAIDAWFAGYPMGVKAAEQDGVGHWSRAPVMARHTTTTQSTAQNPDAGVSPMEASLMIGPDGNPITDEIIVPGSTKIIETTVPASPFDLEDVAPPSPTLSAPAFEGDVLDIPALGDGASTINPPEAISGSGLITESEMTSDLYSAPGQSEKFTSAETLVPRQTATTYSLGDIDEPTSELGDEAIEGIFGAIEMPTNLGAVSSDSGALQAADPAAEMARATDDDIPFKFE